MMKNNAYSGHRYLGKVISHAVWLYHRCSLSFRDIKELLAARGIEVADENTRHRCMKFGNRYAERIRSRAGHLGDPRHLDEVFISLRGERHYLWRAVNQDGETLDVLVQPHRDKRAVKRFFRKLMKGLESTPRMFITDKW